MKRGRRHGQPSTYRAGCRCARCTAAWAARANRVKLAQLRGQWQPWAEAGPVRDHLHALLEAGMSRSGIAGEAKVSKRTVTHLLGGTPSQGLPAPERIRPATAAALLAVRPPAQRPATVGMVEGTATRRRVQALVYMGWSYSDLAVRLRLPHATVRNLAVRSGRVLAVNAAAVQTLYNTLWRQTGPSRTARAIAAREGWAGPLAWDDDTIGDPAIGPAGVLPPRPDRTWGKVAELVQPSQELLEQGFTLDVIAEHFGVKRNSLEKARHRAGLYLATAGHAGHTDRAERAERGGHGERERVA